MPTHKSLAVHIKMFKMENVSIPFLYFIKINKFQPIFKKKFNNNSLYLTFVSLVIDYEFICTSLALEMKP